MAEIIRMPRMSDTMEEGNIVSWLKKEGDAIEPGDLLAEIETDKATMEFESLWEGVLLHIAIKEGPVPVEGVIAVIGEKGEDWKAALETQSDPSENGAPVKKGETPKPEAATPAVQTLEKVESSTPTVLVGEGKRIKASPLAKNMAQEAGIDIANVAASGPQGRVIKRDIEAFMKGQPKAAPAESIPSVPAFNLSTEESYEDFPLSQMRKIIARRLRESKFSAPHFYLTVEVNMDKVIESRKSLNEVAPTKISFNDIIVKAVASALRQHPAVNSSWLEDKIRRYDHIHIGVAVAVEEGLLVPVIRHADLKSLSQINAEVRELAGKARDRKLQPEEMAGNTFTISNLGMFGIEEFTAIINPPDACILAVGSIIQKPIVQNDEMKIGNMMKMTLSCDHRVVDGATGAKFLQTLKGNLEEPVRMLV